MSNKDKKTQYSEKLNETVLKRIIRHGTRTDIIFEDIADIIEYYYKKFNPHRHTRVVNHSLGITRQGMLGSKPHDIYMTAKTKEQALCLPSLYSKAPGLAGGINLILIYFEADMRELGLDYEGMIDLIKTSDNIAGRDFIKNIRLKERVIL